MGRNYKFYKKSVIDSIFNALRNILAVLGLLVVLYFSRTNGGLLSALECYFIEFPLGFVADIFNGLLTAKIF
jgi:hypothetical protein